MSKKPEFASTISNFIPDKQKTHQFFKDTKVDSCRRVFEYKNKCIAVPFNIKNSKGKPLSAYKYFAPKTDILKSIYRRDYSNKPFMHAGMEKKPLVPYNSNSYRNRLPIFSDYFIPNSNISKIDIGNQNDINRKQWISTTKDSYQWPVKTLISNTGILSDLARREHKKLVSIN